MFFQCQYHSKQKKSFIHFLKFSVNCPFARKKIASKQKSFILRKATFEHRIALNCIENTSLGSYDYTSRLPPPCITSIISFHEINTRHKKHLKRNPTLTKPPLHLKAKIITSLGAFKWTHSNGKEVLKTCGPSGLSFSADNPPFEAFLKAATLLSFFPFSFEGKKSWWSNLCQLLCKDSLVCHLGNIVPNVSSVMDPRSRVEEGFFSPARSKWTIKFFRRRVLL